MNENNSQVAIFFDYDNQKVDPRIIFDYAESFGWIAKKRAYGDWVRDAVHRAEMAAYYVELIDRPRFNLSDKKGNDISITVDAMEVAFSRHNIGVFVFVTGDADFIPLVLKLKEYGKTVIIISSKNNTSLMLAKVCDSFVFYENLVKSEEPPPLDHGDYYMLLARKAYTIIKNRGLYPNKNNMVSIIKHFDPSFKFEKTGFKSVEAMIKSIDATWNKEAGHVPAVITEPAAVNGSEGARSDAKAADESMGASKQANLINFFIQLFEKYDFFDKAVPVKKVWELFHKTFPNFKFDKYDARDFNHAVKIICATAKFTIVNNNLSYSRRYQIERGLRKMGIYIQPSLKQSITKTFIDVYSGFKDESRRTLNYLAREVYDKNKQVFSKSAIANIFTALKFSGIFEGVDSSYITYSQPMKINCEMSGIEQRLDLLYLKRIIKIVPITRDDFAMASDFIFGVETRTADIERILEALIKLNEIIKDGERYIYREPSY